LDNVQKGAAFYIKQALKSALDNAVKKTNGTADASNLFISRLTADGGPMLKRYKAGSMGRAMPIKRRTAHIVVELDMVASAPVASSKPRAKKQANKVEIKNKTQAKSKIETKNKKAALAR
jgi:large subunit ribosomal protein L22